MAFSAEFTTTFHNGQGHWQVLSARKTLDSNPIAGTLFASSFFNVTTTLGPTLEMLVATQGEAIQSIRTRYAPLTAANLKSSTSV